MAKAHIRDYGNVEFDPMTYGNNVYDLWAVAICDGEQVVEEEHYTDESEFRTAVNDTLGREYWDEQQSDGWCDVYYNGDWYECECTYHVAYVTDHEEEWQ